MSESTSHNSLFNKHIWLIPVICLLAGGGLIGISTNLAKVAGQINWLIAARLSFLVDYWCSAPIIGRNDCAT